MKKDLDEKGAGSPGGPQENKGAFQAGCNGVGKIVKRGKGRVFFPPVPFPEAGGMRVVSGSPGKRAHGFPTKKNGAQEGGTSLLIGFD